MGVFFCVVLSENQMAGSSSEPGSAAKRRTSIAPVLAADNNQIISYCGSRMIRLAKHGVYQKTLVPRHPSALGGVPENRGMGYPMVWRSQTIVLSHV